MERGLFWLPLLILFFWLANTGKKEYQKLENYKIWAENFETSKYDIYAVLGKKGQVLTWGKPTPQGIIDQKSFSLNDVTSINILVQNQVTPPEKLPSAGEANLQFICQDNQIIIIPFTQINLASQWHDALQKILISKN